MSMINGILIFRQENIYYVQKNINKKEMKMEDDEEESNRTGL